MMDNRNDGLWQGGPWEQPSPVFPDPPAVRIPPAARVSRRPVLRLRKKRRKWPWFLGLAALIGLICLSTVLLDRYFSARPSIRAPFPSIGEDWNYEQQEEHSTEPPSIDRADTGTGVTVSLLPCQGEVLDYIQIYEQAALSVVSIEAEDSRGYSAGTGVVLTQDGYIITNAHVVAGARRVDVLLPSNRTLPASLVGFDAVEDLAVLKVETSGLTPARFGDSNTLRIGEPVAALGDALGYRATFTDGIISALDREVEVEDVTMALIQTTAAINYGNSGGPLLNQYGQVVGINTIKIVTEDGSAEGLGFAIPSRRVKYVADHLIAGDEIKAGIFGFMVSTAPEEGGGYMLRSVERESDAWAKGLRSGDILLEANGMPITGLETLTRLKLSLGAGDVVTLTCLRDGEPFTVDVELVEP